MNNVNNGTTGKTDKRLCPYKEKCYRKNPIHLAEMSHPHLEKLLNGQLTGEIIIPLNLNFECFDRSDLLDQLQVLQLVLKREKDATNSKPGDNQSSNDIKNTKSLANTSESKKQETAQQDSSLKRNPEPSTSAVDAKKTKDDAIGLNSKSPRKSPKGLSIFDEFNACKAEASRVDVRNKAIDRMIQAGQKVPHLVPIGQFDLKYALSTPYNVFLSCVQASPETWSQPCSITFPEILDISLGIIEESLHFNFMVDIGWLCLQYLFAGQKPNSLIFLGSRCDESLSVPSNIKIETIKPPTSYGCHHSKVTVLKYTNGGARIIVSTANLYSDDWDNRTQAVWISPHLPKLTDDQDKIQGEARTGFKHDFIDYLKQYNKSSLEPWIAMLERLNFESIDVFFFASVPGSRKDPERNRWGLRRLRSILSDHAELPADGAKWPIIAQCSSIGSLGPSYDAWLSREFVPMAASEKSKGLKSLQSVPNFQFVYPSIKNYSQSFDKQVGACCLPYSMQTHMKQTWLNKYLYQWKADNKHRTRAIPHAKTYMRLSPDLKRAPWIVVTSGNLSKAAWGYGLNSTTILNYEAGVVFFPQFLIGKNTIPIAENDSNGAPPFPIAYDLPLTHYEDSDEPFVMEFFNQ